MTLAVATLLVGPIGKAAVEPSQPHLVLMQAPTGHRQPTLEDLPPWLREQEKPDAEATPNRRQPQVPKARPDDGVPRICDPC
jgi:hypothetical protein